MPRQHTLPHTADSPGPCDEQRDAWLDAREEAVEATAAKKRKHTELMDAMIGAGISRLAYVDPATNKRKWLQIRSEAKLVSAKADEEKPEGELSRPSRVPRKATGLAQDDAAGETASDGRAGDSSEPEAAGEFVDRYGQPLDGSGTEPELSAAEAGKGRRAARRGAR